MILKIQIGRVTFQSRFVITKHLDTKILLGLDAMKENRISFTNDKQDRLQVIIGRHSDPLTTVYALKPNEVKWIHLPEDVQLQPAEKRLVNVQVTNIEQVSKGKEQNIIFKAYNPPNSLVRIDCSMISKGSKGAFSMSITNKLHNEVVIPEGWACGNLQKPPSQAEIRDTKTEQGNDYNVLKMSLETEDAIEAIEDNSLNLNKVSQDPEDVVNLDLLESPPGYEVSPDDMNRNDELEKMRVNEQIPEPYREEIYNFLKREAPNLISVNEFDIGCTSILEYDIELTDDTPIHHRPYKTTGIRLSQLKDAVLKLERAGIIEEGSSDWAFPCALVTKAPEAKGVGPRQRLIINLRSLNEVTKKNHFPIKRIDISYTRLRVLSTSAVSTYDLAST